MAAGVVVRWAAARARTVILAPGVSWRRLGVPSLEALPGAGVFHSAAGSEPRAMEGCDVFVVRGNSAGQAAIHLAGHAASVTMLVRGDALGTTMSDYLIRKINATPSAGCRCEQRLSVSLATPVTGKDNGTKVSRSREPHAGHADDGRATGHLRSRRWPDHEAFPSKTRADQDDL
jgi:thioredoxin reductase